MSENKIHGFNCKLIGANHPLLTTDSPPHQSRSIPLPLDECAFCHQKGHWKYNCPEKGCPPIPSPQQFRAFVPTISALSLNSGLIGSSSGISPLVWIFYSGASHHMTPHSSLLQNYVIPPSPITVSAANGSSMSVCSISSVLPSALSAVTIPSVLHVPQLSVSLLSVSQLDASGYDIVFSSFVCSV